jgi:alanyl-tRNA synthetase
VQDQAEELAGYEAERLVASAARAEVPVVRAVYQNRTLNELKYLAAAITVRGGIALLGLAGEKAQLVFARPAESALDCGKLLKETLATFGGKGGGQPGLAQGGLPETSQLEAALDSAVERLASAT